MHARLALRCTFGSHAEGGWLLPIQALGQQGASPQMAAARLEGSQSANKAELGAVVGVPVPGATYAVCSESCHGGTAWLVRLRVLSGSLCAMALGRLRCREACSDELML